MKRSLVFFTSLLLLSMSMMRCGTAPQNPASAPEEQATPDATDYLLLTEDSESGQQGYRNLQGDLVIPFGKYAYCLTDTFKNHAVVSLGEKGFAVIDRQEKVLYGVFNYDNGPDYPADGLFRIVQDEKIGYADAATYQIVIRPQFACAFPFENGVARVSNNCTTKKMGEHSAWESDDWQNIDKKGVVVK